MKYAAYGLLAAFLAQGVYGAIPTSAEGWYTPSGGFSRQSGSGTVWYLDGVGNEQSVDVSVDENGKVTGGMESIADTSLKTSYEALVKACANEAWNAMQDEAIKTIGENLDSIFRTDGVLLQMTKLGPGGSSSTVDYTLKIKPGEGGASATIEGKDPIPYGRVVDGKTIGWTEDTAVGQLQLRGANKATTSTADWWDDYGFFVPCMKGSEPLSWKRYAGVDGATLKKNSDGKMEIAGWKSGNPFLAESLANLLTQEQNSGVDYRVMLRPNGGGASTYAALGSLSIPGQTPFDDKSVTTNGTGHAHIVGVEDAVKDQIIYAGGDGGVAWDNPPPVVTYDIDNGKIKIEELGSSTTEDYISLPRIYIEETEDGYLFTWRDLDDFDEPTETVISIPGQTPFDDKSVTTNDTGVAHIVGVDGAKLGDVLLADGSGGVVFWEHHPFAYDENTDTLYADHDTDMELPIIMPRISIEESTEEDGSSKFKFSWRDLYNENGITDTEIVVPKVDVVPPDEQSITSNATHGAVANKMSLYGWDSARADAADTNPYIPYASTEDVLKWQPFFGFFNDKVFQNAGGKVSLRGVVGNQSVHVMTVRDDGGEGKLQSEGIDALIEEPLAYDSQEEKATLKGWADAKPAAGSTLAAAMRDNSGYVNDPSRSVSILSRSASGTLQYMALGVLDLASVDDASLVTNSSNQIALKGFENARPAEESDGGVIPYVDATSDDLQWGGIERFFADSVFRKSESTGKMLLNGTSEEGKVKVLAMTGNGGDDQHIAALAFDNESVDGNPSSGNVVQRAWGDAPSPYGEGVSFADVLTNVDTQITGMSVPLRVPTQGAASGHVVKYVPLAKITGMPAAAVDNKTIEVNEADPQNKFLQLYGAAGEGIELKEGDVYQIGPDGKGRFGKIGSDSDDEEMGADNASIETYVGEDGGKYFRLRDWMDNREGAPHLLGWQEHELKYYEARGQGGIEVSESGSGDSVHLSNFDQASEGAIPYARTEGEGLGWLNGADNRIPLLHTSAAPTTMAIGNSLDMPNVSAVPTLDIAGWRSGGNDANIYDMLTNTVQDCEDKAKHQILCRYDNNGELSVHWVSLDTGRLSGGEEGWTGSFSYFDGMIHDGCVIVGRKPILVSGISATSGPYRVRVTLGTTPTAVLEQGDGFESPSSREESYIPVFVLSSGKITADYRGSFVVPAYE